MMSGILIAGHVTCMFSIILFTDSSVGDTDVYLIYSDLEHPLVSQTVLSLEQEYKLKLCIPDRDFKVGAGN